MADFMVGLALLGVLGGVIAGEMWTSRRIMSHVADDRHVAASASHAMQCLVAGQPLPTDRDDDTILIDPLDGAAPEGFKWVRLTVRRNDRQNILIGLNKLDGGKP